MIWCRAITDEMKLSTFKNVFFSSVLLITYSLCIMKLYSMCLLHVSLYNADVMVWQLSLHSKHFGLLLKISHLSFCSAPNSPQRWMRIFFLQKEYAAFFSCCLLSNVSCLTVFTLNGFWKDHYVYNIFYSWCSVALKHPIVLAFAADMVH